MIRNTDKEIASLLKNAPRQDTRGQAALILILLAAATLIFLAITLNWGRIAQVKALLTVAADQSATLLVSDTASYGEMEKQTYLNDGNKVSSSTSIWVAIVMVVISIVLACFGQFEGFALFLVVMAAVMAVVNLVLQVVVVQPGITSLWNNLQKNQPAQQQFYEQGISTAFQGAVTDQVKFTDYLDSNADGVFGTSTSPSGTGTTANDTVGRFAFFYTERLKMLNQLLPPSPQVVYFYNQLQELMHGETCAEYANDVIVESKLGISPPTNPIGFPYNPCVSLACTSGSSDKSCLQKIPGAFQLTDACVSTNPSNTANYNPYCDPCCQPQYIPGSSPPVILRPTSCASGDSNCPTNNPYSPSGQNDIYDPSFQNYLNGASFLDLFGRDQQMGPFTGATPPFGLSPNVLAPSGLEFPNGVYPFFWMMTDFSPEVDNIDSTALLPSQYHWCTNTPPTAPLSPTPAGFPDLAQLTLPYTCTGADCCVNQVTTGSVTLTSASSLPLAVTLTGGPTISISSIVITPPATGYTIANPTGNVYITAGSNVTITATATTTPPATIATVNIDDPSGVVQSCTTSPCQFVGINAPLGSDTLHAIATDSNGVSSPASTPIGLFIIQPAVTVVSNPNPLVHGTSGTLTALISGLGSAPATYILSVQFYNGATPLGAPTAGSFVYTWPSVPAGPYSITAVATDMYGNKTTSAVLSGTA